GGAVHWSPGGASWDGLVEAQESGGSNFRGANVSRVAADADSAAMEWNHRDGSFDYTIAHTRSARTVPLRGPRDPVKSRALRRSCRTCGKRPICSSALAVCSLPNHTR